MIFKDLFYAMKSPGRYGDFLKRKGWMVFLYGFFLITAYFLIVNVVPMARFQILYGGFQGIVERGVPDFELENGRLHLKDSWYLDEQGVYVDIDTSRDWVQENQEEVEKILQDGSYYAVMIADGSTMAVKSDGSVEIFHFGDLTGLNLSKDDIYQFIPLLDLIIVLIMIAWYIADIALFFLGALILGLAGLIFRQAFNARLSFGQLFLLSIYAKTAALILKGVLNVFSIPVPFGTAMYMAISCGYLALAIKGISEEQERERQLSEMNASWKGGNPVWKPEGRDEDPDRNMNENSGE